MSHPIPALSTPSLVQTLGIRHTAKDSPERVQKAVAEFEAMFLAQMLKTARKGGGGGLTGDGDNDDDDANNTMIELGEQQFAQALASNGGLGIAKMVVAGLTKNADR
jgi:Rod binding domain-containing protein